MDKVNKIMPSQTPGKRTARMTPVTTGTKRRAAIEKRQRAVTLITGGTGFLGSHLVRQLIEEGAKDVRVMATSIPDWLVDLGVETFEGSITNAEDNKRAVEGISEIYHLAGKVSRERKDAREMYDIHVEGTRLLCDAAKAAGVKTIVLASTSGTIAVTKKATRSRTRLIPYRSTSSRAGLTTRAKPTRKWLRSNGSRVKACAL